ncbi:MAG TPA: hypothetical protein VGZ02_14195 [Candidatus Baltobacteraceae bacterium]|nr:hypothetical protein [Candidatus Baltobacteraceae bacterium]
MTSPSPARTVLAVFLGYLTFLILEIGGAFAAAAAANLRTGSSLLISGELTTFVAAAAGGAVAARVAQSRPLAHAGALGLSIFSVTVLVSALVQHRAPSPYPGWYPYANAILSGVGAFVGGALVGARSSG